MRDEITIVEIDDDELQINGKRFRRLYLNLEIRTSYFISKKAEVYNKKSKMFIKPQVNHKGYHVLHLHVKDKVYTSNLHRCVATVWKPMGFSMNKDVDHLDGNKDHNYSSNLEWTTRRTNIKRAYKTGLKHGLKGDGAPSCIYSDEQVRIAFRCICEGENISIAESLSGIPKSYLYTMLRNEIRQDIYNEFDFSNSKINHYKVRDKKTIKAIKDMYNEGYPAKTVARHFNISVNAVYNVCKKREKKK